VPRYEAARSSAAARAWLIFRCRCLLPLIRRCHAIIAYFRYHFIAAITPIPFSRYFIFAFHYFHFFGYATLLLQPIYSFSGADSPRAARYECAMSPPFSPMPHADAIFAAMMPCYADC